MTNIATGKYSGVATLKVNRGSESHTHKQFLTRPPKLLKIKRLTMREDQDESSVAQGRIQLL